jgi:hypothetical protein
VDGPVTNEEIAEALKQVILALGRMGVDFSLPEPVLRQFLLNPFTPYSAITQALLLMRRKLTAPVFLDVIVFNYEHTPGVESPRMAVDVKQDVLQTAILEGSNERHGTQITEFEQLLSP